MIWNHSTSLSNILIYGNRTVAHNQGTMGNFVKKRLVPKIPASSSERKPRRRPLGGFIPEVCPKDDVEGESILNPGDLLLWILALLSMILILWFFTAIWNGIVKGYEYMSDAAAFDSADLDSVVEHVDEIATDQVGKFRALKSGRTGYEDQKAAGVPLAGQQQLRQKTVQQRLDGRLKGTVNSLEAATTPQARRSRSNAIEKF